MTQIHVIQTIDSLAERTGGPARAIRDLSEALGQAGARVSVVVSGDDSSEMAMLPDPALAKTVYLPKRRLALPGDFATAFTALISDAPHMPALVHINGLWNAASASAGFAARTQRLTHVISPHGMLAPWALAWHGRRKQIALWLYQRRLLAGADGLVANSLLEQDDITAVVGNRPIAMIPNGVPYSPAPPDRRHRDAPQPRTVLFMSRIHPKKNVLGLIEAWASLAAEPRFANWRLRIAGPDELGHRAEAVAALARLGLEGRVQIEDAIPEDRKAEIFAQTDVFILPSFSENFGIVVAEALAHGVPVIATIGTPWEQLPIKGCGWHVAPEVSALRNCLAEAMALPAETRRAMGVVGHAFVAENFGWSSIASCMLAFYRRLLPTKSMAPHDQI